MDADIGNEPASAHFWGATLYIIPWWGGMGQCSGDNTIRKTRENVKQTDFKHRRYLCLNLEWVEEDYSFCSEWTSVLNSSSWQSFLWTKWKTHDVAGSGTYDPSTSKWERYPCITAAAASRAERATWSRRRDFWSTIALLADPPSNLGLHSVSPDTDSRTMFNGKLKTIPAQCSSISLVAVTRLWFWFSWVASTLQLVFYEIDKF